MPGLAWAVTVVLGRRAHVPVTWLLVPAIVFAIGIAWLVEPLLAWKEGDYVAIWQFWVGTILLIGGLLVLLVARWQQRLHISLPDQGTRAG